jgi:hypothetical protein
VASNALPTVEAACWVSFSLAVCCALMCAVCVVSSPGPSCSYDYGGQYVTKSFGDGGCKCGAETCWGKLQAKREAEAAAAAAAGPSQL